LTTFPRASQKTCFAYASTPQRVGTSAQPALGSAGHPSHLVGKRAIGRRPSRPNSTLQGSAALRRPTSTRSFHEALLDEQTRPTCDILAWMFETNATLAPRAVAAAGSPEIPPGHHRHPSEGRANAFLLLPNPLPPPPTAEPEARDKRKRLPTRRPKRGPSIGTTAKGSLRSGWTANLASTEEPHQVTAVFGDSATSGSTAHDRAAGTSDGTTRSLSRNICKDGRANEYFYPAHLEASIVRDPRALDLPCAVVVQPRTGGREKITKFFHFNAVTGARENTVNIDGPRRKKKKTKGGPDARTGIACQAEGGCADSPRRPESRNFNLLQNVYRRRRGRRVQAQLPPFEVDGSSAHACRGTRVGAGGRAHGKMNRMILCCTRLCSIIVRIKTLAGGPRRGRRPGRRRSDCVQESYGGACLPQSDLRRYQRARRHGRRRTDFADTEFTPHACRVCHIMRGNRNAVGSISRRSRKFQPSAEEAWRRSSTAEHASGEDRVRRVFQASAGEAKLATFSRRPRLPAPRRSGNPLRPGRPIADTGPNRVTGRAPPDISPTRSLFSDTYVGRCVGSERDSPRPAATLTDANTAQLRVNAKQKGPMGSTLVASNDSTARSARNR